MIALDEQELFRTYAQAKQVRIESLLDQYGSSLADMRELYPQLTETIEKQRLVTTLPTQALFFIPSEAADMGLSLEEGWMLKVSPVEGGYKSSFITPSKWEITEDELYISPAGEQYSRADMEALLAIPTGEYTVPEIPVATTIDDLTEEGKIQYQGYQSSGGQLDVVGWLNLREEQQVETEQVFGKVFPQQDITELNNYIQTNPEGFLTDLKEIGWNADTESLLKYLIPEITTEEMQTIFGVTAPYVPESWIKDNILDPLYAGAVSFVHGLGMAFTSILPSVLTSLQDKIFISPAFEIALRTAAPETEDRNKIIDAIQLSAEQRFTRLTEQNNLWVDEHPELTPNPRYFESPFENTALFRDPGYYAYSFTNSLAYSLATMGTIVAVSAVATPFVGIPAGLLVAGGPEAGSMTEELVRQGVPFEEAVKWGSLYGLVAGGVEVLSDLPFLGLVFKPVKTAIQPMWDTIFKGVSSRIARGVIAGVLIPQGEALEEIITQVTHNAILQHYDSTQSLLEGVSQAYIQATIASLPFGAIGGMASYRTFRNNLSPQTGQQLDTLIKKFEDAGLTLEQAQVQAVNEMARTPEMEAELSKAIDVAKQEYQEEHPVTEVKPEVADKILDEMRIAEEVTKTVPKVEVVTPTETRGVKQPWQMDALQYQLSIGVEQPWIAEISPWQMGRMSERQKKQYFDKRDKEWQASADAKTQWRDLVFQAYQEGKFTLESPNLHPEAKRAIQFKQDEILEAEKKKALEKAHQENQLTSVAQVEIGDRVWNLMIRKYGEVIKKFQKSIRVKWEVPLELRGKVEIEYTGNIGEFQRLAYDDVAKALETQVPVSPKGPVTPSGETVKEPWQMTLEEYITPFKNKRGEINPQVAGGLRGNHRNDVSAALREGKPVPAEVLKDYPELQGIRPTSKQAALNAQRLAKEREAQVFKETEAKFAEESASTESISEREARRKVTPVPPEVSGIVPQAGIAKINILGEDKSLLNEISPAIRDFISKMADAGYTVNIVPRVKGIKYAYVSRGMEERPFDIFVNIQKGEINESLIHEALHQIGDGKWNSPLAKAMRTEWETFLKKSPAESKAMGFTDPMWNVRKKRGELLSELGEQYIATPEEVKNNMPSVYDFFNKYIKRTLPTAEAGMPEAGLQPSMLEEVPSKEVIPAPTGKLVQARLDDYLRLREYNKKAVTDRIAEIKKSLETKGRLPVGQGTKGDLRLELARLDAQQELDAVKSIEDLDLLIRTVEKELGRRSLPGQGEWARSGIELARHPRKPNIFPEYTSRQLDEMRNVYLQARGKIEPATATVKAEDIPSDMPALTNTQLTPAQVEKTIELFKQAVIAPNAEMQRAAAIELRKHVLAQRAKSASESAEAMITEGANPEEAIRMAEQMFMTGKLPDLTTDYFDDLTQEMRNVLFAKVYNYWKDKSWFELISTFEALTNTLAGKSIPRVKGIGSKYFPDGGSAWDRLARVFVGDIEVLNALDQGKSLRDVIQGVLLESGRGVVTLNQETVNWLKELSTISEEDKLLLTKPLSALTEEDVRRIATKWFWKRQNELNTLLAAGTITRSEYQLELAIAKDRVFPHKPMGAATTYPTGVAGQPRLGEGYTPIEGIPETRTAEELRLAKFELEKKQREATTEPTVTPPPSEWAIYNEAFKELPLLTFREKNTIVRTLKNIGMTIVDIGNLIRANKASFDFSFWRQAKVLAMGHPVKFYHANIEAWKALWNQQAAEANWAKITRHPFYQLYLDAVNQGGTDFLRPLELPKGTAQYKGVEEFGFLTGERLIPRITARIPWVKLSSRSFVTGTNDISWNTFVDLIKGSQRYAEKIASGEIKLPEGEGFSLMDDVIGYTKMIGDFGQRASLGKAAPLAPEMSALFFAPRSKLGRLIAPRHLVSSNPRVRAEAWRDFSTFIGAMGGLVMLGYWLGLWDVEDDPRNAEFMSIRIGNLRIDPWAGYRQFLVLYARLITGTGISSVTGQEYEVNPIAALTTFFRGSLAPLASILLDFWTGKDFLGDKIDISDPKKWVDRIAPFAIQDIYEAFQDNWQNGLIAILPAIVGEGVQTYTGDWRENWAKMGLPKYPENTGYGIYEPIYDLADFWADTASQFKGVDPATLTASKGFPEYVRSIATALQIIDQLDTLPNKKLTSLNADPEKGTTFMQYYQMWQDRQKIVASGDTEKLKTFDADERTRNAYLGNITQAQYALLVEYHSLPESEKADFLGRHPELYINPREEWLRTHPQENALLALWGKADVYTSEALSQISTLTKQLDIPENALVMKDLDPVTELKLKNQHLSDLLDAYGGLDDTLKGPDGLTARDRAIKQLYLDNPDFREDQRRIEALNVGTKDNPTIESMIEGWVERGQIADEFGSSSAEMKLWLIDNREVHQWALENGLLSDTGEDWNENILRLEVNYREDFDKYDNYGEITSPLYIASDTARADAREAMIFSNDKMTSFGVAYYTINALQKNIPENLVTTYVDYYGIRKKEGVDYSAGWYDDDWYLLEHKDFYQTMLNLGLWQSRDFSKVPTRQVYSLYQTYMGLPTGTPRLDFRAQHLDLDNWLVKAKGYTPVGSR